ncbi:MAG TPA: AarF/UbiB family protein [Polyangia bacterium]|nr:AarF/UbiB family protein [Polyangia bacterium]
MTLLVRFLRAAALFATILISYLLQIGLLRVFGRRRAWVRARARRLHRRNARRLLRGILRLRGVYIKLGQVLSIMGTFLPRAFAEELESLQDAVPPHPFHEIERSFTRSLGRPPRDVFAKFDETPMAAASLGQVHRARTADGEEVAVKVLYPNVSAIIAVDLRVLRMAMRVYRRFVPVSGVEKVVDQLQDLLRRETDYVHEGRCIERMARNFEGEADLVFPRVRWDLTTDRVLTMSFMHGIKISRASELRAAGVDPEAVARRLVKAFYKQLFLDRFFHADPHPGNFLVQPGTPPRIVVLDFGAASTVPDHLLDGALDVLRGLVTRNDDAVVGGIDKMGFMARDGNRALLERTVRRYFEKLLKLDLRDFGKIKPETARALADPGVDRRELRELMRAVEYPDGWFFVERAAVLLFGLSAQLAPTLNTVLVGVPYVMQLIAARAQAGQALAQA